MHLGVGDHRLHAVDRLERGVQVDRVEDAEDLLADVVAAAGGAAQHLLVEDAAPHPAQEHDVADGRHVDAGGEQVHGDRDRRVALVLEAADELERLVGGAGDLEDRGVLDLAVAARPAPP
jgi:hypothetical protein